MWFTVKLCIPDDVRPKYDFHKSVTIMVPGLTRYSIKGISVIASRL